MTTIEREKLIKSSSNTENTKSTNERNYSNKESTSNREINEDKTQRQKSRFTDIFKNAKKRKTEKVKKVKKEMQTYNLDKPGKIELAKIHTFANRPLRKIREFNNISLFCPCCNLPSQQWGVLEPLNFCDDTTNFNECGQGVTLYFSFLNMQLF